MLLFCAPRGWAVRLRRLGFASWVAAAAATVVSFDSSAADSGTGTLLYDATSNKLPSHSDWGWYFPEFIFQFLGYSYTRGMLPGATFLDTTSSVSSLVGYSLGSSYTTKQPNLDSAAGFVLNFSLRIAAESHSNENRAGFSIIVLDEPHRGIELGFWPDQVWAQNVDFSHGEWVPIDTQASQRAYSLAIFGDGYSLSIDGVPRLAGSLRVGYSGIKFGNEFYDENNYIFFGDNTGSAQARFELSSITLTPIPEPNEWALMLAGLGCVVAVARRRRPQASL